MIELERTYLAKRLPEDLEASPSKEMLDVYLPVTARHPILRIRKNGEKYEITKKQPVNEDDVSVLKEETVRINEEEFVAFSDIEGKRVGKTRYIYDHEGRTAEVDVFRDVLEGLVLVDFEFENEVEKDAFEMPDFCLVEVTQEEFIAGGFLAGKSYEDIADDLARFGYGRLK